MKNFLIFLIVLLLIIAFRANSFLIATANFGGDYSVYEKNKTINVEYDLTLQQALLRKIQVADISGESVRFIGNDSDIEFLLDRLNIRVVDEYCFSNIHTIYGYSARLGQVVKVSGKKVNIQIAKRGGLITVGCPLIQGSY